MSEDQSHSELVLDLAEEFLERHRRGERPALSEYTDRFPELADEIREVFPAMLVMENLAPNEESADEACSPPPSLGTVTLEQLGDYRLLREVGRGGMGIVYEAEQISLGRRVALKILPKHATLDERHLGRFEREARAAARLHHTNIVPVYGVGVEDGTYYYAMQFIQGLGLDEVLRELRRLPQGDKAKVALASVQPEEEGRKWSHGADLSSVVVAQSRLGPISQVTENADPAWDKSSHSPAGSILLEEKGPFSRAKDTPTNRLSDTDLLSGSVVMPGSSADGKPAGRTTYWQSVARIGLQVAGALAYAHKEGVLHRDIKPANLLMDARGNVWITDFGLAKSTDTDRLTHTGDIIGTLSYMAPEVFSGKVDVRCDVYALGLTLYELAALRPAHVASDRHQLLHQVMHEEPPRLGKLNREIPRDLETIVHKAIDRDPRRRYQSAEEVAGDLERFINDEPIQARRISLLERLFRWARHHRGVAASLGVIALLLVAATVGSFLVAMAFVEIAGSEAFLRKQAEDAEAHKETLRRQADEARARALQIAEQRRQRLVRFNEANGVQRLEQGDLLRSLPWFVEALRLEEGDPSREQVHRTRLRAILEECPRLVHFWRHADRATYAEFSPDGRYLLTRSRDGKVQVHDTISGHMVVQLSSVAAPIHHRRASPGHIHFHPDSRHLVTVSDRRARMWDLTSPGEPALILTHDHHVRTAGFSPDGRRIATLTHDTLTVWDVKSGKQAMPSMACENATDFFFSPDGRQIATVSTGVRQTTQVWDVETGREVHPPLHSGSTFVVAFNSKGLLLTASWGSGVSIWDGNSGKQLIHLDHPGIVPHAAFSPDGRQVITSGYNGIAQVWDAKTGRPVHAPLRHDNAVQMAEFSRDGLLMVTACLDGLARVWEAKSGQLAAPSLTNSSNVLCARFNPDGQRVVTCCADGTVRLWDLAPVQRDRLAVSTNGGVGNLSFDPEGTRFATAGSDGTARVWDATTGKLIGKRMQHNAKVLQVEFSPDGRRVITACLDWTIRIWDAATGEPLSEPLRPETFSSDATPYGGDVAVVSLSPDGKRFVSGVGSTERNLTHKGEARVWSIETGKPLTPPMKIQQQLRHVDFSPNGQTIVIASGGVYVGKGNLELWDAATGERLAVLHESDQGVAHAKFSPDGRSIVACEGFKELDVGVARVWDVATGLPITPPLKHSHYVPSAHFSPDGKRVVTASLDHTARIWDAKAGQPLTGPLRHRGPVSSAHFDPQGHYVLTAVRLLNGYSGGACVWDAASGRPVTPTLRHFTWVTEARFSPDGKTIATAGSGIVRLQPFLPDQRPISDWVTLAQLLAGHRIDSTETFAPLSPQESWDAFIALRCKYLADQ